MKEYLDGEGMSSTRPSNALLANFNDLMQFWNLFRALVFICIILRVPWRVSDFKED
jgi:hypothetical protein